MHTAMFGILICRVQVMTCQMNFSFSCISDDRYNPNDFPPRHHGTNVNPQAEDEFDPACTRTLFVGNIEKSTTCTDLKDAFGRFGEIVVRNWASFP